jgi:Patatin-like phospholipase
MSACKRSSRFVLATAFALLVCSATVDVIAPHSQATAATRHRDRPAPVTTTGAEQRPAKPDENRNFNAHEEETAIVPGFPDARFVSSSEQDLAHALQSGGGGPWLVLSAGGADAAYGAGVLCGWSARGTRPDFAVVTGVSAGALIAPYAFLGARYDDQLRDALTTITDADIFEAGQTPASLLNTWPLRNLLAKRITPQLLADVAAEHRRGRRLFVVTADLDSGRSVVWNMGAIAARGGDGALSLFRDVLLASASLPGVFPPTYIDVESNGHRFKEMHADGGIGGPFFVGPESWLIGTGSYRLPAHQLYVIVNGKLAPEFDVTPAETLAVLGRAFSAAVKTGARVEIAQLFAAAQRDALDVKVAHISESFDHRSRGLFDPDYMRALFDFGFQEAQAERAFTDKLPVRLSQRPSQ